MYTALSGCEKSTRSNVTFLTQSGPPSAIDSGCGADMMMPDDRGEAAAGENKQRFLVLREAMGRSVRAAREESPRPSTSGDTDPIERPTPNATRTSCT
jgi:hypothetical protein